MVTVNENFAKANENDEFTDATSYRSLIGSLLFLAKQTRPDTLYGVNVLSRFVDKPTKAHMQSAKRIFFDIFMVHQKSKFCIESEKIQFCWMKVMQTGVQIKLIENQPMVFISNIASTMVLSHGKWDSNKVALSSSETEYQRPAPAAQEVLFLRHLLCELQHPQQQSTSPGKGNHSAIKLSTNPVFHKRSTHINV